MARGSWWGNLAAALMALLCGCGLFDLRNPESPGSGPQVPFDIPTQPRIALKNLKATTEARVVTNFDRSLSSDYRFRFDPFEAGTDTAWTKDRDIQAITTLFRNEATVRLDWRVADSSLTGSNFIYRNLGYHLVFTKGAADSFVIDGTCYMYFRQEQQQWLIYRWEDLNTSGDPNVHSWGYARLNPNLGL